MTESNIYLAFKRMWSHIVGALNKIATVLSSIVTALCSFFYVKNKRTLWITIVYIISVILVIVFIILV